MKIENTKRIEDSVKCQQKHIEETKEILQFSRKELENWAVIALNTQLQYTISHSPFYSERYKKGMLPKEINHFSDLLNIPFTTKEDLRKVYPLGFLAVPQSKIIRYGESTGTTGPPTSSYLTRDDWERNNIWLSLSLLNFFSPEDMVFIAVPYELAFAAHDVDRAFWNIGSTIVSVGALNMVCPWERVMEMMKILNPSVLICTPTRALRLYDMFLERGYDPLEVHLKTLLYLGEACSSSKLKKIAKLWNINIVSTYGSTETNTLSLPCHYNQQHLTENRFYFEVIDPSSGAPIQGDQRGELVITSLFSQAMPLIRYRTGDIVSFNRENCSCGLPLRTFQHYGRYNESIVIGANNILKMDLEETILSTEGTGCYYAVFQEKDQLRILVEITEKDTKKVEVAVKKKIFQEYGVDSFIEKVDKSSFYKVMDSMLKPGRASIAEVRKIIRG